ncbi:MAG: hypothetical protein K0Q47_1886 [Sedimentibacter sp.]|jgi:hypothetical protein|nr:hypothetical protein [Sedimentibacter sp.]
MDFASITYLLMILLITFFITTNVRNNMKYKKENMQILMNLNADDKSTHLISSIVMIVLIIFSGFAIIGMINTKTYTEESVLGMVILPLLMIFLYVPMLKKTKVSNLGIHKKNYLIRWEDIKGLNYLKPDAKDKVKAKILYTVGTRDTSVEVTFMKDDQQLEEFKELVKEYKSSKKKSNKSKKDNKIEK